MGPFLLSESRRFYSRSVGGARVQETPPGSERHFAIGVKMAFPNTVKMLLVCVAMQERGFVSEFQDTWFHL